MQVAVSIDGVTVMNGNRLTIDLNIQNFESMLPPILTP